MIPKLIHSIWLNPGGLSNSAPPDDVLKQLESWSTLHPGFTHKIWSLEEIYAFLRDYDSQGLMALAVGALKFPAMQSDLLRLALLQKFGGYWVDLKLTSLQPFLDSLTEASCVLTQHYKSESLPNPGNMLINSFIGAEPNHPVIRMTLEKAMGNVQKRLDLGVYSTTSTAINFMRDDVARGKGIKILDRDSTWGVLFKVGSRSYNKTKGHWSDRVKTEGIYNEVIPLSWRTLGAF